MDTKSNVSKTKDLVVNGLLIAIVFVATYFIQIRLPISVNGGLIHLGNVALFSIAIVFGPKKGAIAGAFGMGLFDILSGWISWAPFTFIIRGVMGYLIGYFAFKGKKAGKPLLYSIVGMLIASVFMILGYYLTEVILYGSYLAPLTSIAGNITQLVIGITTSIPASLALDKINPHKELASYE
ncbi:MAG: ECF transporter S component [Acidaminobacteraceae bacterium]